jgi:hypothetical protein
VNESGRSYAHRYKGVQRREHHAFLEEAIERSGGRVLFSSGPDSAPLFLGVEDASGQRVGICAYVFLANRRETRNRPADEHRLLSTSRSSSARISRLTSSSVWIR